MGVVLLISNTEIKICEHEIKEVVAQKPSLPFHVEMWRQKHDEKMKRFKKFLESMREKK
jgi:hypothetical protein